MRNSLYFITVICILSCFSCKKDATDETKQAYTVDLELEKYAKAYFASGCFWCVEGVFERVIGVKEAVSGYSGGSAATANYSEVSAGTTLHAEGVKIYYDSTEINYETLLIAFFGSQDPTTPDQQGPDVGPQYRSVVFYQTELERTLTENYILFLDSTEAFNAPIVTEILMLDSFYIAEDYHQDYIVNHPSNSYVLNVSIPRIEEFELAHPELLK
jgi:peptide-methionine (S)-S-oxide reductase